jgi:hypothetical protein
MAAEVQNRLESQDAAASKKQRFQWLAAYELTFQSLVDSIHDGLRADSSLKQEAWNRASKALRDVHGITVLKPQLMNKYDNAKKKFRVWRTLREQSGFGYDQDTKCITAPDHVWDAYIKVS